MIVTVAEADIRTPARDIHGITTAIIRDQHGNPLVIAIEQVGGFVYVASKADKDFDALASRLGIGVTAGKDGDA